VDKLPLMFGVANKLFAAESTIDTAMADTAALLAQMVEARKAANVSPTVDVKAHAKVVEAMTALSAARVAMVDAHNEMNEIKLRLGVRTKMNGVEKAVVRGEESAPLRIVNSN
jgi:hypothetical protein